jgi:hypothetical protein
MRRLVLILAFAATCAAPAAALDMPSRKAGLWEIKMTFEGRNLPPQTAEHCIDAATDKQMMSIGGNMRQDVCSKQDVKHVGSTIVIDSVCKIGNGTATSHAEVSGDFNSAYTVKVASKTEGGPSIPGRPPGGASNMTIAAKWLGPCKAGQKPGDIVMAGGRKFNIIDMQNIPGMPGAPKRK